MQYPARSFTRVLIANRGEIGWRIVREAQAAGLTAIAVYSDADAHAAHVQAAAVKRWIGAAAPAASYLNIPAILAAAKATGAEAVHPGYGFLAENAAFADSVIDAGMVWIGPPPAAIRAMGDKGAAKRVAREAGVPLIPGYDGDDQSDATLSVEAVKIGWPVMIKAAMGGGGRGMRRVERIEDFASALESARREAKSAFADDRVILEKAIDGARHVEVQVFGDTEGNVVHLGERDCSVQRRNQKVLEEAPAPGVSFELRAAMGAASEVLARAVGYVNAGTVEFLLAPDGAFYFLEMNTRIQVEHPVTEMVTGLNLIRLQFDIAMGKPLSFDLDGVPLNGHAIEARLCAEDPVDGFKPQTGTLSMEGMPRDVRVDWAGTPDITGDYDSIIAKIIAHGATRDEARLALIAALDGLSPLGLATNRRFLRDLLADADFAAGGVDTGWLSRRYAMAPSLDDELGAIAAALLAEGTGDGWSSTGERTTPIWLKSAGETRRFNGSPMSGITTQRRSADSAGRSVLRVTLPDGREGLAKLVPHGIHVSLDGRDALFEDVTYSPPDTTDGAASGEVRSPMAGKIVALKVAAGAAVSKGDVVAILESMKMEHEIRARASGIVASVITSEGAQVSPNAPLLTITPSES